MGVVTLETGRAQARLARVLKLLQAEHLTPAQIAAEVFISKRWIYPYIAALMAEPKRIYVVRWQRAAVNGEPSPVYAAGDLPDAPKPAPRTAVQRSQGVRDRLAADLDRQEVQLARRRARRRAPPKPDALLAWVPRTA